MPQSSTFQPRPRLDLRPDRRSRADRLVSHWRRLLALAVLGAVMVGGAVASNAAGAGDRFDGLVGRIDRLLAGPVPDRSSRPTVVVTEPPVLAATASPEATVRPTVGPVGASASGSPAASAVPTPIPTPLPPRVAVDVDILDDPEASFVHQATKDWCAVAGTQMVLAIHDRAPTSDDFQRELASRIGEWESYDDSHNGKWGPAAMALALEAYGVPGYEVRAYETRASALRDAARQVALTDAPAILLTWRGAHTWVMTGYRADADPVTFADATVSGAYILDPWYPSVSSIWGPSNPPGFFTGLEELEENYLRWKRPEGQYADRDERFIAVVPTIPRGG